VQAMIPGMDADDIKLSLGKHQSTLSVSGFRPPSTAELDVMRRKIAAHRRQDRKGGRMPRDVSEDDLLIRLGAGKFGSFQTSFNLPGDCNPDGIKASYEGGRLTLIIPKNARFVAPQRGRQQGGQKRHPYGYPPFFGGGGGARSGGGLNDFLW